MGTGKEPSAFESGGPLARVRRRLRDLLGNLRQLGPSPSRQRVQADNLAHVVLHQARAQQAHLLAPDGPWEGRICRQRDWSDPRYAGWCSAFGESPLFARKQWEFVFICQALEQAGLLASGRRGLGFGVGREPLPALFAARGCMVTATDMAPDDQRSAGWVDSGQHASGRASLSRPFCPSETFDAQVEHRAVDMTSIPADLEDYDFCWSSCALEHLGSLEGGLDFVRGSLACLKPGGLAVHTTEFNLRSDDQTLDQGWTVLYRRRDLAAFFEQLEREGHRVHPMNWASGDAVLDSYVDVPPFRQEPHLRLLLEGFVSTSAGFIIQRGP